MRTVKNLQNKRKRHLCGTLRCTVLYRFRDRFSEIKQVLRRVV